MGRNGVSYIARAKKPSGSFPIDKAEPTHGTKYGTKGGSLRWDRPRDLYTEIANAARASKNAHLGVVLLSAHTIRLDESRSMESVKKVKRVGNGDDYPGISDQLPTG